MFPPERKRVLHTLCEHGVETEPDSTEYAVILHYCNVQAAMEIVHLQRRAALQYIHIVTQSQTPNLFWSHHNMGFHGYNIAGMPIHWLVLPMSQVLSKFEWPGTINTPKDPTSKSPTHAISKNPKGRLRGGTWLVAKLKINDDNRGC